MPAPAAEPASQMMPNAAPPEMPGAGGMAGRGIPGGAPVLVLHGGSGGAGGFGGGGMALPGPVGAGEPVPMADESGQATTTSPAEQGRPSDTLVIDPFSVPNQSPVNDFVEGEGGDVARRKSGTARLSVQVALEVPPDYRSREFKSIGDSIQKPGRLELSSSEKIRFGVPSCGHAGSSSVVLVDSSTGSCYASGWAVVLGLAVAAAVPMLDNQWQSVADGLLLGAVLGFGIWFGDFLVYLLRPFARGVRRVIARMFGQGASQAAAAILVIVGMLVADSPSKLFAQEPVPPVLLSGENCELWHPMGRMNRHCVPVACSFLMMNS